MGIRHRVMGGGTLVKEGGMGVGEEGRLRGRVFNDHTSAETLGRPQRPRATTMVENLRSTGTSCARTPSVQPLVEQPGQVWAQHKS